ncbi:MAG TPA: TonB-dependent receptor [Opitutaceae bacterium]|nr:TonB-dependent receptor [Opitutaceae bacterium]
MPLPRRESVIFNFFLWLFVGSFFGGSVAAATVDYSTDAVLARTTITVQADSLSLAEALTLVENQTTLRFFVFDVERLPLNARVMLTDKGEISLAGLLMEISAQAAVTFGRRDNLIDVRGKGSDGTVVSPPGSSDYSPYGVEPEEPGAVKVLRSDPLMAEAPATAAPNVEARPAPIEAPAPAAESAFSAQDTTSESDDVLVLDVLNIQGKATKGSVGALRSVRANASVAIDYLSATQMAKYSGSDLSEIVFRIPGVSVAGGQFAVIRGLSDRYTNTTFNGLKLPSPDPERQSPQLDILPTALVDSIVISKSFAPYLWADTSGGSIDLTNAEGGVDSRRFSISYGIKANDNALDGGPRYSVPKRRNDWIAAGSKSRPGATLEEFQRTWDFVPQHDSLPLGQKFSLDYGNGFQAAGRAFGFAVTFGYELASSQREGLRQALLVGHKEDVMSLENSEYRTGRPTLLDGGTWDYEQSKVEVTIGGLLSTSIELSENHDLRGVAFWTRTGSDSVQTNRSPLTTYFGTGATGEPFEAVVGYDQGERRAGDYDGFIPQAIQRFRDVQIYTERKLSLFQLAGAHEFGGLGDLEVNWVAQRASTYQDEPNLVDARYFYQLGENPFASDFNYGIPVGEYGITPSGFANLNRFWGLTQEDQTSFRVDGEWTELRLAGRAAKLRIGGAGESTDRTFDGSNYTGIFHSLTTAQRTGPDPDEGFNNLVANDSALSNRTEQSRDITATFVNLTIGLPGRTDLVAGARFERFGIDTEGKDNVNRTPTGFLFHYSAFPIFGAENIPTFSSAEASQNHVTKVSFSEINWYPSIGLIFRPTDALTFRVTVSQTSGRPSLREMGPYYNRSLESGEYVVGNPFLRSSEVANLDTRVEWVRDNSTRYAASLFAKRIKTPIEKVFLPGGLNGEGVETWSNNPNTAKLYGAEFEFQRKLGWGFSLGGNFTWIKAEVEEHPSVLTKLRADSHLAPDETVVRPLFDQPEYIANLDLTWSHPNWGTSVTLAGFAISDVLETAGGGTVFGVSDSALDIYDRASQRVDLTFSQPLFVGLKLKINVTNLTDPVQGTVYDPTRTPEELTRNAYRAGRNYTLSLSKDF